MTDALVIAGTDTNVGKTIFAAALTQALCASYWKPIQAGLEGETDSETVKRLANQPASRILPEAYRLKTPASPHTSAAIDGVEIDVSALKVPQVTGPLVIELAGGLMVPLTARILQIDVLQSWRLPVILVASTRLGTINHCLLSIEALKRRAIPIRGIAFTGEDAPQTQQTVADFGQVQVLGRLPVLSPLRAEALHLAFARRFDIGSILGLGERGP